MYNFALTYFDKSGSILSPVDSILTALRPMNQCLYMEMGLNCREAQSGASYNIFFILKQQFFPMIR